MYSSASIFEFIYISQLALITPCLVLGDVARHSIHLEGVARPRAQGRGSGAPGPAPRAPGPGRGAQGPGPTARGPAPRGDGVGEGGISIEYINTLKMH